jgi:ubiquinone/menaquinone biosynthesis C-methylase UbiE
MEQRNPTPHTIGAVLHSPARYDLQVWLFTLGRERALREKILALARLQRGEMVLDIGCGTGNLAIAAKRHVGPTGAVYGIDASPEMLARAERKARKAAVDIVLTNAMAQVLPFPDAQFDVVLSTVMLHHLTHKARQQCAAEMRRVLKPGGRVLVVEFGLTASDRKGVLAHFHRHGHVKLPNIIALLSEAGLTCVQSGAIGFRDLQFVLAKVATVSHGQRSLIHAEEFGPFNMDHAIDAGKRTSKSHLPFVGVGLLILATIALHVAGFVSISHARPDLFSFENPLIYLLIGLMSALLVVKVKHIARLKKR